MLYTPPFLSAVRTHAILVLLERTVEARDVTRADRGDERREDVCEDGEAVHELVRGVVPVEDVQGDEVGEDAPKGRWLARGEDREVKTARWRETDVWFLCAAMCSDRVQEVSS
ncbi:hypothetical protein B0H14DRAFT_3179095 [Mycena olivaceomarginata]|nr:hypothetical protein B0H14DRAFT_3179095 [Mycena olivaceomarginata]